jgi:hypothetical protein
MRWRSSNGLLPLGTRVRTVDFPGVNPGALATIVRAPLHLPPEFGDVEGWSTVLRTDQGTFRRYFIVFDDPQEDEDDPGPYTEMMVDERAFEVVKP